MVTPLTASFIQLQHAHKCLLRHGNGAKLTHTLLAFLLLLQQLLLPGNITPIALGKYVLPQCLDGFSGDDLATDGSLDGTSNS